MSSILGGVRDRAQEMLELGPGGLAFRAAWEFELRSGLLAVLDGPPRPPARLSLAPGLPFGHPAELGGLRGTIGAPALEGLLDAARKGAGGRILGFGRHLLDYRHPIDWHRDPVSGERWPADVHWSKVLRARPSPGDVKLVWEAARFPQAYHLARAAAFFPDQATGLGRALAAQVDGFLAANPYGKGPHWASGQETAFRLMAWTFAASALAKAAPSGLEAILARALFEGATAIERHLGYSKKAVYNNHLISEAVGLLLAGTALPGLPQAARWSALALELLTEQAGRQFYPDGGYIQLSHNYERVALQGYLFAAALRRAQGAAVPGEWLAGMERGLDFLHQQQNPEDGRLPNFGFNDGALPCVLSTCEYGDFRPLLQSLSVLTRAERLYPPGPWDEEAAWWLGAAALQAPLRPRPRRSVSFGHTGFHVLRAADERTFAAFRCGTVRDRFAQVDMLSLDVWWRGQNVLVDPGSYLYNGPREWHDHFVRTAAHNTVVVDGRDQMLHYRQFKCLYWTEAELLRFGGDGLAAWCSGEHHGYRRHPGRCVHRRSVLMAGEGLWVVVDRIEGDGVHLARLQWLGGEHPWHAIPGGMVLGTPAGPFHVQVLDDRAAVAEATVAAGQAQPPRGWLSRHYAEKVAVPSLVVEARGLLPITLVSVLSSGPAITSAEGQAWTVRTSDLSLSFQLEATGPEGLVVGTP
ncbi:MAG: alginate lyase family protein [Anaeromyxobacter sp.]|nr:alginate lyase family protein [Anaeromyxobacter sp.]